LRVKQQTITIQNLPGAWQDKTIVQISDVHAGAINKNRWLEKMADQINALNPEAIFITGDYFDGTSHDFARLASPLARLRARAGVFFVTGNHETYLDTTAALDALRASQVRVLDNETIDLDGLKIIGLSYGQGQTTTLIGLLEQAKTSPAPKILLYHIPRLTAEAKAAGINLQLSGHTHRGQIFPFNLMTRLIYGRYHYGWHQDGDYHLNTAAGTGTWGPPLRTTGAPEITAITIKAQN